MSAPRRLLLVNGPNLNLLGMREPAVYGSQTLADVEALVVGDGGGARGSRCAPCRATTRVCCWMRSTTRARTAPASSSIPGGLTHTSVVLRDALSGVALPVAEVHISDVMAREPFRHHSYVADVAIVHVVGEGVAGYATAVDAADRRSSPAKPTAEPGQPVPRPDPGPDPVLAAARPPRRVRTPAPASPPPQRAAASAARSTRRSPPP